jgi:DNA-binding GntR family transcriptional regulator
MLVSGRVGAIRYAARRASTSRRRSGADHEAIIQAFAARDLAKAVAVLREHIMNMRVHFAEAEMGKARLDASPARA